MSQALPGFRVLVADDDRVIAKTMSQILRLSGYEADMVCSGEEAVIVAAKTRPDVFISDVLMGGITGIEAAIRILKILPACRVILISGHANTAHQLDGARRKRHEFETPPSLCIQKCSSSASPPSQWSVLRLKCNLTFRRMPAINLRSSRPSMLREVGRRRPYHRGMGVASSAPEGKSSSSLRVLIAGGGTGGHIIPALAVAHELVTHHQAEVLFVGTPRGMESRMVPAAGFQLRLIEVGPLKNVSACYARAHDALTFHAASLHAGV